jgi:sugar transferase (PEP-CTERM system associated)
MYGVVRIFSSYVPARSLVLLFGEIATICLSFTLAIVISFGDESRLVLANQQVILKILSVVVLAFLCSHYLELHDPRRLHSQGEIRSRILILVGILSFVLAGISYVFPEFKIGRYVFLTGLFILALAWMSWRWVYVHLISLRALRERVYVLGDGERAGRICEAIESRSELGMDLVGVQSSGQYLNSHSLAETLRDLRERQAVDRVIVALADRRSVMPVNELLDIRLRGIRVDDGTSILEKVSGKIEIDELRPSWMIFGDGFRLTQRHWFLRRLISTSLALMLSLVTLPLIPIIALLIRLTSRGPIFYKQKRVGLRGESFDCFKFRTMKSDAEADSGPTWASDEDPRITRVGKFLRRSRLDEIPQIWNVLRGDMAFVGPRPERPEFVAKLAKEIPYYSVRHALRPGITGWAQINYGYGSSVEEAKEKLRFDLYYIRNVSVMLDLLIVFYTLRAVIIGRGVR